MFEFYVFPLINLDVIVKDTYSKCLTPINFLSQYQSGYKFHIRQYLSIETQPLQNSVFYSNTLVCIAKVQTVLELSCMYQFIDQIQHSLYFLVYIYVVNALLKKCFLSQYQSIQIQHLQTSVVYNSLYHLGTDCSRTRSCSLNILRWYQSRYNLYRTPWSTAITQAVLPRYKLFSNSLAPLIYSVGKNPDTTLLYSSECITLMFLKSVSINPDISSVELSGLQ